MILDTDVLSALSSPHCPRRVAEELARAPGEICTTAINWAEICYGLARRRGSASARLRARYEAQILPLLRLLDFDRGCAEVYAQLRADLERKGERLAEADLMVAAVALRHKLPLISGNTRHFARIPKLKLENWLEE